MDFSEYETASEFAQDFESDHEPPKDQLFLKKMVHKAERLRIYKRIAKLGKSYLEMPAKFDQAVLRIARLRDNSLERGLLAEIEKASFDKTLLGDFARLQLLAETGCERFESEAPEAPELQSRREQRLAALLPETPGARVLQLGRDLCSDAVVLAVSNMKKGELAYFEAEQVGLDPKTKERRLQGTQYFLVELLDFVTVIDVFGDGTAFKVQLHKGEGIRRVGRADRLNLRLSLKKSSGETLWEFENEGKGGSNRQSRWTWTQCWRKCGSVKSPRRSGWTRASSRC